MILEQAFYHLPEILHGSGYQHQDYEAGIVGALSLAVLQVLNGRNVANPISCIQHEHQYRTGGIVIDSEKRYLRTDLFLKLSRLQVGSKRLSQYGWRHSAWVEAKFLRNQTANGTKHSANKTSAVANYLADIIRLCTLVPEKHDEKTFAGRYFLHVYDAKPDLYLTFRNRKWMKELVRPGRAKLEIKDLEKEPQTIKRILGHFIGLEITAGITNFEITPTSSAHQPCYWMYLTRIDSIDVSWNQQRMQVAADRGVIFSSPGALDEIAIHVAKTIQIDPKSAELEPPPEKDEQEEVEADTKSGEILGDSDPDLSDS